MPEEYFELAYINFDKVIMHGRAMYTNEDGFRQEKYIEQVLTAEQKRDIEALNIKHDMQMQNLLRSFVSE